jgi:hypothetical protein
MNVLAPVSGAALPKTYEAARTALAQCQAIDECKDWADKAAALASYARQSEDVELERMAARIRARAMRRAGEIAKQMMQPHGGDRSLTQQNDGGVILMPKEKVQEASGFSERQLNNALRVASVPERQFTEQVESANPPTITELARQGTQKRDTPPDPQNWLKGRSPQAFNAVLHFLATIEDYAKEADTWPLDMLLANLTDKERGQLRQHIASIDAIHDKIATRI